MTAVTPQEFLREILAPAPEDSRAWVTRFDISPLKATSAHWGGALCLPDALPPLDGRNSYYSVAVFPADAPARKGDFIRGVAVVLCDDVTTKGNADALRGAIGEPNFRILTSPGNEQWGYLLKQLATREQIKPIHAALKNMGLVDESGHGPVRYGRLPDGINNKKESEPPFAVHCVEWRPTPRYDVAAITAALAKLRPEDTAAKSSAEELIQNILAGEALHDSLRDLAAHYARLGMSSPAIIAQLQHFMHSSARRQTAPNEWQARYDDIPRLVESGMQFAPPRALTGLTIELRGGAAKPIVAAVVAGLAAAGEAALVFARGQMLVRPFEQVRSGFGGELVVSAEMAVLNNVALAAELGAMMRFTAVKKNGEPAVVDCPPRVAAGVLAMPYLWERVPLLEAIATAPIYLGNGRLLATSGYHRGRGVWMTVPEGIRCATTREAAADALTLLRQLIEEFPFATDVDEAVMLAAIMTAVLRVSLPTAPGIAFDAPDFGTGKSTGAKLVHIIGFGREPAVMTYEDDEAEVRKQVDAAQIAGQQSIVFDNVPPGVAVAAVGVLGPLLSERYGEVRKLGESVTYRVPCNQLTLFTGNNISIVEDLTRRVIDCRLDAEGDPLDRQFQHPDLLEIASRRRAEFISAVFTVAAAYEAAGAPTVNALPMPGYGQWCAWVQRPLIWLGVADPVLSTRALMGEDPAREALEAVCRLWYALHGEEWIAAANLLPAVTSTNDQRRVANELRARVTESVTVDKQGRINTKSLGRWLRRHLGKWTSDGLILQREAQGPRDKTAHRWRVFKRVTRGYSGSQRVSPIPFADENREGGEKEEENAAYRKPVDSFETREHPPAFSSSAATSTNKPVKPDGGDDSLSAVDVSDLIPANPADDDDDVPL